MYSSKNRLYITSIILGIILFILIYGINVLNPTYDDWLLEGADLTQHYLGWEFFRASSWQFPIGLMDRITYPNLVSIIFTDSIPILAVIFKLLSPILPLNFQYFGWWGLICFILQSFFSIKLLYYLTKKEAISIIGGIFLILSPIFIYRMFYHTALSSQWLIILALYLGLKSFELDDEKIYYHWIIMGILAASIHLYYVPMCGIIMLGFCIGRAVQRRKYKGLILTILVYCASAAAVIFLLGGFSNDHQLDAGGLGQFSFNMNGFCNSMGNSKLLKSLSTYGEGYVEGFAYLGVGIIILIIIVLVCTSYDFLIKKNKVVCNVPIFMSYFIICLISLIVSASHKLAIGDFVIDLPYPEKLISLWGMFRSSGRFIWPFYYIIMITAIKNINKFKWIRNYYIVTITAFCLLLQIYDSSVVLGEKQNKFNVSDTYQSKLQSIHWEEIAKGKEHVVFVTRTNHNQDLLYSIGQFAYENGLTINDFYLAHSAVDGDIIEASKQSMNKLQNNVIYIFKVEDEEILDHYQLNYYIVDNIIVGLKDKNSKLTGLSIN